MTGILNGNVKLSCLNAQLLWCAILRQRVNEKNKRMEQVKWWSSEFWNDLWFIFLLTTHRKRNRIKVVSWMHSQKRDTVADSAWNAPAENEKTFYSFWHLLFNFYENFLVCRRILIFKWSKYMNTPPKSKTNTNTFKIAIRYLYTKIKCKLVIKKLD